MKLSAACVIVITMGRIGIGFARGDITVSVTPESAIVPGVPPPNSGDISIFVDGAEGQDDFNVTVASNYTSG